MVRALAFALSLASLLLGASAAWGQPTACTRYENGKLFILPGCRGPGDYTGGRVHPFTGQPWGGGMAIVSWNQLLASMALATWPLPVTVQGPHHASIRTLNDLLPRSVHSEVRRRRALPSTLRPL